MNEDRKPQILCALCLSIGIALFSFAPSALAAPNDADAVVKTASTFYKNYLAWLKKNDGTDLMVFLKTQEVEPAFIANVKSLFDEAEKTEPGFLDYDPILFAQDIPDAIRYGKPGFGEAWWAKLVGYMFWGKDEPSSTALCISVAKIQNRWRITDVSDFDLDDKNQNCGAVSGGGKDYKKIRP